MLYEHFILCHGNCDWIHTSKRVACCQGIADNSLWMFLCVGNVGAPWYPPYALGATGPSWISLLLTATISLV